jgi:glycosyltransferase involved in cell wall biosynthesis
VRFLRAAGIALSSREDSLRTRVKLLYQLAAASTQTAWIERAAIEHIHAHFATPSASYALFIHLLTGIPYSFTGHAADLYRGATALAPKLAHAAGAVAISEYNLDHYRRVQPDLQHAEVIHCGIDPSVFHYRERETTGRPLRILTIGRCTPKKGFPHLLDALAILQRDGIDHIAHLVGYGEQLPALEEQARRLGLRQLEFTGPLQQAAIRDLLDRADVFVLPCVVAPDGDVDGIPVVLMEAMASGCPVISSRVSGIPELVEDGVTGLVTDPGDHEAIAAAIRRLAETPRLVHRFSRAGRRRVEKEFNVVENGRRLERFFLSLRARRA